MFFPDPKDPKALPVSPLLVFNASWPAVECNTTGPDYDTYNTACGNLVRDTLNICTFLLICALVWQILQHSISERPQHQEGKSRKGQHNRK